MQDHNEQQDTEIDEVLQEVDVVVSNRLADHLNLIQYPLRPNYRPYGDQGTLSKLELKPNLKMMKMNYSLNTNIPNYDTSASDSRITNHELTSTFVDACTNYGIGVFWDGKFYLTPISNVYQMRSSFTHVDSESLTRKNVKTTKNEDEVEERDDKKLVRIQLSKKDKDKEEIKKMTHAYLVEQQEKETWMNLKVYPNASTESDFMFKRLYPEDNAVVKNANTVSTQEYLDKILKEEEKPEYEVKLFANEDELSLQKLEKMTVKEQVYSLLKKAGVLGVNQLIEIVEKSYKGELNPQEIQDALDIFALEIRKSVYVLKSEAKNKDSGDKDILDIMRDYVLLWFYNSDSVSKTQIIKDMAAPSFVYSSLADCLKEFGYLKEGRWHLKVSGETLDEGRPKEAWRRFEENINSRLEVIRELMSQAVEDGTNEQAQPMEIDQQIPEKSSQRSEAKNPNFKKILKPKIEELLEIEGVLSFSSILESMVEVLNISLEDTSSHLKEAIAELLQDIAEKVETGYILKTFSSDSSLQKAWDVILQMYKESSAWKKKDIKKRVKDATSEDINDYQFGRMIKKIAKSVNNNWHLKESAGGAEPK